MKSLVDLESKYCYADGGKVTMAAAALNAVKNAISHIENGDHTSALATLRASPAAMAHPEVRAAASQLVTPSRAPVAAQQLRGVQNADTDARVMPTFAEGGSTAGIVAPQQEGPGSVSKLFHFMVQKMGVPPEMAARYSAAYHDPSSVVLPPPVQPQPPPQQMPQQGPPQGQGGPPPGPAMGGQPGVPGGQNGQSANPQLIQQALQQQMGAPGGPQQ